MTQEQRRTSAPRGKVRKEADCKIELQSKLCRTARTRVAASPRIAADEMMQRIGKMFHSSRPCHGFGGWWRVFFLYSFFLNAVIWFWLRDFNKRFNAVGMFWDTANDSRCETPSNPANALLYNTRSLHLCRIALAVFSFLALPMPLSRINSV